MSSIRTRLALPAALSLALSGCEMDFTGVGEALAEAFCGGTCPPPPVPTLVAAGTVRIGEYQAWFGEVTILVYSPPDTMSPVRSVPSDNGYRVDLGPTPLPDACAYLARAVLWSGEKTGLTPLFEAAPCQPSLDTKPGPDFSLPAYAPLSEPFTVTGRVLIHGAPPTPGAAPVSLSVRNPGHVGWVSEPLTTDAQGVYRFQTTDRAQWFALCRMASVEVAAADPSAWPIGFANLTSIPPASCDTTRRELPDVRAGTAKAARGYVYTRDSANAAPSPVGAGAARVTLLDPADSSVVGEEFETHDEGSFHVWFPQELESPGCGWLLRAELADGTSTVRPLLPPTYLCQADIYHEFVLDAAP